MVALFRRAWHSTPTQVTHNCSPGTFRIRLPGTNQPFSLSIEIDEYGPCSDVLIAHGLYSTPTIAC
ncbi:hypothetical protein [Nocardia sp. NPDC058497]|uniref:hypothetical protein n=1 Tax=Nocardia sp. NPDC058497 TaxID=3346529 RepID=UPI0036474E01